MQNLNLTATTQGVMGGKNNNKECGYSLLTAKKGGIGQVQISIDLFEGSGKDYKERENPQIEIYFPSSGIWIGTASELKEILSVHYSIEV